MVPSCAESIGNVTFQCLHHMGVPLPRFRIHAGHVQSGPLVVLLPARNGALSALMFHFLLKYTGLRIIKEFQVLVLDYLF